MADIRTTSELNAEVGIGKAGQISKWAPMVDALPMVVRSKFMKALKAQDEGDMEAAEAFLNEAVAAEVSR